MEHRQLQRLDVALSLATAAQRPVLLAQRAQLLARLGRDAAWQVLAQACAARVEPEAGVELELALARALCVYFLEDPRAAAAVLAPALEAAQAAGLAQDERVARALAWMATMRYVRSEFALAIEDALAARGGAAPVHRAARARASLTLANLFAYAEDARTAQYWFESALREARADDDLLTIEAVLHKMAIAQAGHARVLWMAGAADAEALKQALVGVRQSELLMQAHGVQALDAVAPLHEALVLMLQGCDAQAIPLFDRALPRALAQSLVSQAAQGFADRAVCRARSGDLPGARTDLAEADRLVATGAGPGVQATLTFNRAIVAQCAGEADAAAQALSASRTALAEVDDLAAALRAMLRERVGPVD
jgi:hypothetical protein